MSDDAPNPAETRKQLPGCGLAAFAMLLVVIFTVGISGVLFSTFSILTSGNELSPRNLSYGGVVDPSLLKPMRDAGLIGPDEIPDAFHAENVEATAACALSGGNVIRVGGEGNASMPIASIKSVEMSGDDVVIHGDTSIVCHFRPGEGGDQLKRMLDNRDVQPGG